MFTPLEIRWSRYRLGTGTDPVARWAPSDAVAPRRAESAYTPGWAQAGWSPRGYGRLGLYGATLIASGLAACASMPSSPTPEMTRAESAIEQAQRAGAGDLASEPLEAAQHHLSAAKAAADNHDNVNAARLVDEAYADARLADFTAQSEKSAKAAAEVDTSIRTLETEANRPRSP